MSLAIEKILAPATGHPTRPGAEASDQKLNIAVVFTSVHSTLAALKQAGNLAHSLGAHQISGASGSAVRASARNPTSTRGVQREPVSGNGTREPCGDKRADLSVQGSFRNAEIGVATWLSRSRRRAQAMVANERRTPGPETPVRRLRSAVSGNGVISDARLILCSDRLWVPGAVLGLHQGVRKAVKTGRKLSWTM